MKNNKMEEIKERCKKAWQRYINVMAASDECYGPLKNHKRPWTTDEKANLDANIYRATNEVLRLKAEYISYTKRPDASSEEIEKAKEKAVNERHFEEDITLDAGGVWHALGKDGQTWTAFDLKSARECRNADATSALACAMEEDWSGYQKAVGK